MGNFEDAVNEAVPDNNYVKPLMIAAGALLLGHLFGGKKDAPADPSQPQFPGQPAQPGQPEQDGGWLGGLGAALNNALGGGQAQPGQQQLGQQPGQPAGGGFLGSGGGIVGGLMNSLSNSPFGGVIAGAAAGTAVSAGLDGLLNQFRGAGHAETVNSWVGTGANHPISPDQINNVLGQGKIAEIAAQAGVSPEQLSQLLAQALPSLVDKLTPGGRLPQG
jgi:uncharacterized protein YidB (DUF937 family)